MADHRHTPNSLPDEITLNIFSRLPAEAVLDCNQVCRSWRNLLQFHASSTNYFAYQHLENQHQQYQNPGGSAVMSFVAFDREAQALYYSEYVEDQKVRDKKAVYYRRRVNIELPVPMFGLVGSCNGLICLSLPSNFKRLRIYYDYSTKSGYNVYPSTEEPSYICNPITREFVNLPAICIDKNKSNMGVRFICGFGYHPQTNEYKVVRISYIGALCYSTEQKTYPSGLVEIYTFGKGSEWKRAGETNFFLKPNDFANSVCVNGSLHWLQQESEEIVAFDLAQEEFHLVPTPPCRLHFQHDMIRRLCVIRSCVGLVYKYSRRCSYYGYEVAFDLWFLKENKLYESSTSHYKIEQPYKCRSWCQEFSVDWTPKEDIPALYRSFALTEGSELLVPEKHGISRYDLNTGTTTKLGILEDENWYKMVPLSHINSFVSLKALGERNVDRIVKAVGERSAKKIKGSPEGDDILKSLGTREAK